MGYIFWIFAAKVSHGLIMNYYIIMLFVFVLFRCDFEGCPYATHFIENLTKHKKKHRKTNEILLPIKSL